MERLLINWIGNQEAYPAMVLIQTKARDLYQKIKNEQDFSNMSQIELKENFTASKGWYHRFKKRTVALFQNTLDAQNGTLSKENIPSAMED